jgi:hypothetical protein
MGDPSPFGHQSGLVFLSIEISPLACIAVTEVK